MIKIRLLVSAIEDSFNHRMQLTAKSSVSLSLHSAFGST